jgi:formylglycine-generating enzyme required for sulfatase activity
MGSDKNRDPRASDDELPQHRVEVAAFRIGKYPVTVAEYALADSTKAVREPPEAVNVTWKTQLQRLDHPVVCVSWKDAMATNVLGWRLPSEAE